jgi:hypothetical protein
MDVRDPTASVVRAAGLKCGGGARLRGEVSLEARARPRQSSRGLGKDSGALRATWRTQPWHNTGTGAPEGAERGGVAQRQRRFAPTSNRAKTRATNG